MSTTKTIFGRATGAGGGGGDAPADVAYLLLSGVGAAALTAYRVFIAGASMIATDGGALGMLTLDIGKSIWTGSKADTAVVKEGILNIPVANTSSFTGIAATGNSLINMEGNTYSGPAVAVVVAGGGAGAGKNTINNVSNSLVSGITHALSGGANSLVVAGYNNTVTGGQNQIIGGQQNTITNGICVDCNGVSNSISNTTGASVTGQSNNISGGSYNKIDGILNGIVTGTGCSAVGYSNSIT
ncbi:MAG: hypothetical protein ACEQSA_05950, partial [Weeksellaceae bacterium]